MAEFSCRTKTISGTDYRIKIYLVSDNSLRASTSFLSQEAAQSYIDRMNSNLGDGKYRFEIITCPWTQQVCIECGKEEL